MALSEFTFNIEFISGEDNGIADSMSRLCLNNMIDCPREYSEEYIISASGAIHAAYQKGYPIR